MVGIPGQGSLPLKSLSRKEDNSHPSPDSNRPHHFRSPLTRLASIVHTGLLSAGGQRPRGSRLSRARRGLPAHRRSFCGRAVTVGHSLSSEETYSFVLPTLFINTTSYFSIILYICNTNTTGDIGNFKKKLTLFIQGF